MQRLLAIGFALSAASCATPDDGGYPFSATGVFVRNLRVSVAPSDLEEFEDVLKLCVSRVEERQLSEDNHWLAYREPPSSYFFIWFADVRDGFVIPTSRNPMHAFVRHFAGDPGVERLDEVEYAVEWSLLMRQKPEWSTVDDMSTKTHPEARVVLYSIAKGREAEFDSALSDLKDAFVDNGYDLPTEGFTVDSADPTCAMQVVFAPNWPTFHERYSMEVFGNHLDRERRTEFDRRLSALRATLSRIEYVDASHAPELRAFRP